MALRNFYTSTTNIIHKKNNYMYLVRGITSALHIPGHLSKAAVSILTPDLSQIDRLITKDLPQLQNNLLARNSSFDLSSFIQEWKRMTELRLQRETLEARRLEVSQMMRNLVNSKAESKSIPDVEKVKKDGIQLRTQLKELTKTWWDVEEVAVTRALSLPNTLHPRTPVKEDRHVSSYLSPNLEGLVDETRFQDVKFVSHSPTAFYLRGLAARLELDWMRSFSRDWIDSGYNLISAPDFVRSLIVDGCGFAFNDPTQVLSLASIQDHGSFESGNGLHLVGGSSLPAIVAFLTKNVIKDPYPLRLVSVGRCYSPAPTASLKNDLTNSAQSSSIHLLTTMKNCPESMFQELLYIEERITNQLKQLNVHFRVTTRCARQLEPWEQYRSSFEFYSSSLKKYVEVANVSIIGDYICRRLSIYGPDKESPGFVSAQALSVPKLLACYLENLKQ